MQKNFSLFLNFSAFQTADIPTVVPDRWELPHCCLKIGRVLGSGAFGQVVKGRVSKSMLFHRGIDLHGKPRENRTHITVAIKMLQGECWFLICIQNNFCFLPSFTMLQNKYLPKWREQFNSLPNDKF